ncbi:DNPEP isoform 20 [Pongo abelii]|uniref:DNPEP isoform 20 n=1 Tax=Pongo abelii TaxID=9601 RepID=A0A2J8TUK7_PONAB|nr:DNPEP isoform 20 [Pongo abelii]
MARSLSTMFVPNSWLNAYHKHLLKVKIPGPQPKSSISGVSGGHER